MACRVKKKHYLCDLIYGCSLWQDKQKSVILRFNL